MVGCSCSGVWRSRPAPSSNWQPPNGNSLKSPPGWRHRQSSWVRVMADSFYLFHSFCIKHSQCQVWVCNFDFSRYSAILWNDSFSNIEVFQVMVCIDIGSRLNNAPIKMHISIFQIFVLGFIFKPIPFSAVFLVIMSDVNRIFTATNLHCETARRLAETEALLRKVCVSTQFDCLCLTSMLLRVISGEYTFEELRTRLTILLSILDSDGRFFSMVNFRRRITRTVVGIVEAFSFHWIFLLADR